METFIITFQPASPEGDMFSLSISLKDVEAAKNYARLQLGIGHGMYEKAVIQSKWQSENGFRQAVPAHPGIPARLIPDKILILTEEPIHRIRIPFMGRLCQQFHHTGNALLHSAGKSHGIIAAEDAAVHREPGTAGPGCVVVRVHQTDAPVSQEINDLVLLVPGQHGEEMTEGVPGQSVADKVRGDPVHDDVPIDLHSVNPP